MRGWTKPWVVLGTCLLIGGLACDEPDEEVAAAAVGPLLGALEVPVSLRRADTAPADAVLIEVSPDEARVAGKSVLTLTSGQVSVSDVSGALVPKLVEAIKGSGKQAAAVELHASLPYRTVTQVLNAAQEAGVKDVSFKVRGNGGPDQMGYLATRFTVGERTASDTAPAGVAMRPWSDFSGAWEAVEEGCRSSDSGSCAYKPELIAEGGELKIVLFAAGAGVNVNMFRIGAPSEAPADRKPVEKLEGVPADPVADAEAQEPATEALFQFRAHEAVKDPSAVTATLAPLCKVKACDLVVQAEAKTMAARVLSMLGAAMPDGAPVGMVRFEIP